MKRLLRWIGIALGSIAGLAIAAYAVVYALSERPGGRGLMVMPAEAYVLLTDDDLGRIIAFLRSLPAVEGPSPSLSLGPLGRIGVAVGQFKPVAELIAETVPPPEATSEEAAHGRYLARTTCAACHGTSLRGASNPDFTSPSLELVAAYSPEGFAQLMREGVALGERNLNTMSPWSRQLLSHLTDCTPCPRPLTTERQRATTVEGYEGRRGKKGCRW